MKRILKWLVIGVTGLIGLLIIVVGGLYVVGQNRLASAPDATVKTVAIPTDPDSEARGEHLARAITACADCHGENLAGTVYLEDPTIGVIPAPNLTTGQGGLRSGYTDEDWVRALRYGVAADGRTLTIMPSNAYAHMSDEDLGMLIAYMKSLSPVDNKLPPRQISFPGAIIFGVLAYGDHAVSKIDHKNVGMVKPAEEPSAAYGEYLSMIGGCHDCHGPDLAGRSPEEAQNGPPPGPNLTPVGELGSWSDADFLTAMRTGNTPSGRPLSKEMPWRAYSQMSDVELQALWAYLGTLEPTVATR
jgi:mono/diheme cytochrome c family protein